MSSTESTASPSGAGKLMMENVRREYRERGHPCWYLHGLPPVSFEPYPCDLRMKLLHHDATLEAEDKTDSRWFFSKEVDLARVAASALVEGVAYKPTELLGGLEGERRIGALGADALE